MTLPGIVPISVTFTRTSLTLAAAEKGMQKAVDASSESLREVCVSNGVLLHGGRILTVGHVVSHAGWRREGIIAAGRAARLVRTDGDLALLAVDGILRNVEPVYGILRWNMALDEGLVPGAKLTHRWWDHPTDGVAQRIVIWDESQHAADGFEHGMSGSGLYLPTGKLVALAEYTSGFMWGPLDIETFLEET